MTHLRRGISWSLTLFLILVVIVKIFLPHHTELCCLARGGGSWSPHQGYKADWGFLLSGACLGAKASPLEAVLMLFDVNASFYGIHKCGTY
jgi:hypothetical protein